MILAKIDYVGKRVNYQKCGDSDGIYKSKSIQIVTKIKYSDGRVQEYKKPSDLNVSQKKKSDLKGLFGFFLLFPGMYLSLFGFINAGSPLVVLLPYFVGLFALGLIAFIVGIRSIIRVNRDRKKYYQASIFLAVLSILAGLLLITLGCLLIMA